MNTKTIKSLLPFLLLLSFLAYNIEAGSDVGFMNGGVTLNSTQVIRGQKNFTVPPLINGLDISTLAYSDTLATASALALSQHVASPSAHECATVASQAYVQSYSAAMNGSTTQDFNFKSGIMNGNLQTNGNWISNDGGNEGFFVATNGYGAIGTSTPVLPFCIYKGNYGWEFNPDSSAGRCDLIAVNGTTRTYTSGLIDADPLILNYNQKEVRVGASSDMGAYILQVSGDSYFTADVSALTFTDRSESPDTLEQAYSIVQSHEAVNGHVDHSKLHSKAWGKKGVETGRTNYEVVKDKATGKEMVVETPEIAIVPDQAKRNISMVVSAQAEIIKDLIKRLEKLEKK